MGPTYSMGSTGSMAARRRHAGIPDDDGMLMFDALNGDVALDVLDSDGDDGLDGLWGSTCSLLVGLVRAVEAWKRCSDFPRVASARQHQTVDLPTFHRVDPMESRRRQHQTPASSIRSVQAFGFQRLASSVRHAASSVESVMRREVDHVGKVMTWAASLGASRSMSGRRWQ